MCMACCMHLTIFNGLWRTLCDAHQQEQQKHSNIFWTLHFDPFFSLSIPFTISRRSSEHRSSSQTSRESLSIVHHHRLACQHKQLNFKASMGSSSRILIIGATGYLGRHVAKASLDLAHPTFLLVRESTASSNSEKAQLLESFKASGANILHVS